MAEADPSAETGVEAGSTLTCPKCGHAQALEMPTDSCLFFHQCAGCGALLSPEPGDCCVFCSYGSAKCPPKQAEGGACCGSSAGDDARGTVKKALEKVPDKTKRATVAFDSDKTTPQALTKATADAGYPSAVAKAQ